MPSRFLISRSRSAPVRVDSSRVPIPVMPASVRPCTMVTSEKTST